MNDLVKLLRDAAQGCKDGEFVNMSPELALKYADEIERLKKNSDRYLWLRDGSWHKELGIGAARIVDDFGGLDEMDDVIDAAIKAKK